MRARGLQRLPANPCRPGPLTRRSACELQDARPVVPANCRVEKIVNATLDTYFAPNKRIRELHELMKSGAAIDPLKDFSEAAREELRVRV